MEIVIDAQVVCGYFKETVLEVDAPLTAKAEHVFERVGSQDQAFLDDSGHIEHEWRSVVDPEWFDPWYARLLISGGAVLIPTELCHPMRKKLEQLGFPRRSRDIWYIRAARAVVDHYGRSIVVTEDMDFYEPTQKKTHVKERQRILLTGDGRVASYLYRKHGIDILCVACYLELVDDEKS